MQRRIKSSIFLLTITASLIPLLMFAVLFFQNIFTFFSKNDRQNIESILKKEKKYIEKFVEVNIKDVKLVSTSDNVRTLDKQEIIDVFTRVMKVRDDFEKMRFLKKNGEVLEVSKEGKVFEYKKAELDYFDKYALENKEIAYYTNEEGRKDYICFASSFIKDADVYGTCIAYMPTETIDFFTDNIKLDAIGEIYIKDNRDKFLIKKNYSNITNREEIQMPINNSHWTLVASINNNYFKEVLIKDALFKMLLFLFFIIISIIPIAKYISINVEDAFNEIIEAVCQNKKIEGRNMFFYSIYEFRQLKNVLNKLILNRTRG